MLAPVTAYLKPGDTVHLQGTTLEVIGVVTQVYNCPNYIVSPETFFEMGGLNLVESIYFISNETQDFIFGTDFHEQNDPFTCFFIYIVARFDGECKEFFLCIAPIDQQKHRQLADHTSPSRIVANLSGRYETNQIRLLCILQS